MDSSSENPLFKPGTKLGNYEVVALIGEGGMGQVYEAYEKSLDRKVALKVISPDRNSDEDTISRFKAEGRALASLKHPNLVTAYSLGFDKGVHFLAMEFVDGTSLDQLIKNRVLKPEEALPIFVQLLEGMNAFHSKTILHRDIKPKNIVIEKSGIPRIVDFGIVKNLSDRSGDLTSFGTIIGTVNYLAPEVVRGEVATPQSDIWSLGVTFFEMLTGERLFATHNSLKTLDLIKYKEIKFPENSRNFIPETLKDIVLKMIDRDLKLRYSSAQEIITDIKETLGDLLRNQVVELTKLDFRVSNYREIQSELNNLSYTNTDIKRIISIAIDIKEKQDIETDKTIEVGKDREIFVSPDTLKEALSEFQDSKKRLSSSEKTTHKLKNQYSIINTLKSIQLKKKESRIALVVSVLAILFYFGFNYRSFVEQENPNAMMQQSSNFSPPAPKAKNPESDCNPFAEGLTNCKNGLIGDLFYLSDDLIRAKESIQNDDSYPQNQIAYYIKNGIRKKEPISFPRLYIPQRHYTQGLFMEGASPLTDNEGNLLIEHFALRLNGILRLNDSDPEGDYQLGIISDDGAIIEIQNQSGTYQVLVDNDGPHGTQLGCAKYRIHLTNKSRIPIRVSYFQGAPTQVALMLMWRPWTRENSHCGEWGLDKYFGPGMDDFENYAYGELLDLGWKPLRESNLLQPY